MGDAFTTYVGLIEDVEHIPLVARESTSLSPQERGVVTARVLDFVTERVAPQAEREDESTDGLFYTGLAAVSGSDGTPWHATDHDLIRRRARELAEVDLNDGKRVQTLLYQLHVAIARHFAEAELMVSSTWDDAA